MLLLVLGSSAGDGDLACSASLIILHLYAAHPVGGFLVVGDEVSLWKGYILIFPCLTFLLLNQKNYTSNRIHYIYHKIHNTCPRIYIPVLLLLLLLLSGVLSWDQWWLEEGTWTLDLLVHQFQMYGPQSASWSSCKVPSSFWFWWCSSHQASPTHDIFPSWYACSGPYWIFPMWF